MSGPPDVLVLAAFPPELAPLARELPEALGGEVGGALVAARVMGIGLPGAAVGAALHVAELRPRAVLAMGTCGAYLGSGLAVGDVVVARRVRLVAPSALEDHAQFPDPMRLVADAHVPMAEAIAQATGARPADIATTLGVTVNDATAGRIARATGADVEHLEAFGVAVACEAGGVPFGAVLAVANFVGANGREQWRVHHDEAASRAAGAVLRWLRHSPPPSTSK